VKRILSVVLVLLALGVAAFFFIKLRRFLPERARAAELAPADSVLFVQVPNLRETAFRVPGLDLYAIWMEPDVQAFLEKPRKKAPWMQQWEERFDEVVRVAPGEMFVAFTAVGAEPEFVGGFSFAGSRRSAEALVEKSRDLLPGKFEIRAHSNWMFFASNGAALEAVVERFDAKGRASAIGGDPAFQQAIKALGVAQDLVVYGRTDTLPALGISRPKTGTAALGTRIQKGKLHDTIFLPAPPAEAGKITQQALALTSPQTLLYYTSDFASLPAGSDFALAKTLLPQLAAAEKALAAKGLAWTDLPAAFGPEFGAIVEWPEDAAVPTLVLAPQIRDGAKAQQFVEAITAPGALGSTSPGWALEDRAGIATYTAPAQGLAFIRPALALTDRFALAGLTPEALNSVLLRARQPQPSLSENPVFVESTRQLATAPASLAYLDFQRLFERLYRLSRPFITLSLAFSPEAAAQFDAGKLPPVEAIARHLGPLVVTQTRHEHGLLIESTGSITFTELMLGASAGAMASGLSKLTAQLPGLLPGKTPATGPATRPSAPLSAPPVAPLPTP